MECEVPFSLSLAVGTAIDKEERFPAVSCYVMIHHSATNASIEEERCIFKSKNCFIVPTIFIVLVPLAIPIKSVARMQEKSRKNSRRAAEK